MTKPKGIYILDPNIFDTIYGSKERRELQQLLDIPDRVFSADEAKNCPALLEDVEVIFSSWGGPRLDAPFMTQVPRLKAFFYGAGSVRSIVTDEFWEKNIPITSAASANAIPVAEFTHAQIMLSLKRLWWCMRETQRMGSWPDSRWDVPGAYGSTVGIVSLGLIGRMVREKLRSSDVQVLAYDPYISTETAESLDVKMVSLKELFSHSDVVSVHTPLLKATEGIIGRELLLSMKKNATFINTARGMLVKEEEMLEVLQERADLFAVIDVACSEPPEKGSLLYSLPNIVMTPHISGSIRTECGRMGRFMVEELKRYLHGEPFIYQVSPQMAMISA